MTQCITLSSSRRNRWRWRNEIKGKNEMNRDELELCGCEFRKIAFDFPSFSLLSFSLEMNFISHPHRSLILTSTPPNSCLPLGPPHTFFTRPPTPHFHYSWEFDVAVRYFDARVKYICAHLWAAVRCRCELWRPWKISRRTFKVNSMRIGEW